MYHSLNSLILIVAVAMRITALFIFAAVGMGAGREGTTAEARYTAGLSDGSRVSGADLSSWDLTRKEGRLAGKNLFDPENPIRWLKNNSVPEPREPEAFVEFLGGDRLPGLTTAYRQGTEFPFQQIFPHLVVDSPAGQGRGKKSSTYRVATEWIRRVVWRRAGRGYQPGTIFFRDGRKTEFRSYRWKEASILLLLQEGIEEVPFPEIAELDLPSVDPWELHYRELAILCPGAEGLLVQIETEDGLLATGSIHRYQLGTESTKHRDHWLQPAWSLESPWIPHNTIRLHRFFPPHRVPLSRIEPSRIARGSTLGGSWHIQRDRNVEGGPLASGGIEFGWGLGTHAMCEIHFDLPPSIRTFRSKFGLDRTVGRGGCARAIVVLGNKKPLFESKLLLGSSDLGDTGPLALQGQSQLVLVADPAHQERPPHADPLDIRDRLDWLEPELELDPGALQIEIQRRTPLMVPAWQGWKLEGNAAAVLLTNRWDRDNPEGGRFRLEVIPHLPYLKLTRSLQIREDQRWLFISANRLAGQSTPARIHVRIGKESKGDFPVREWRSGHLPDPILLPLEEYSGQETAIAIYQLMDGQQALVNWQSIEFLNLPPDILRIFEDERELVLKLKSISAPEEDQTGSTASLDRVDRYSGTSSLKITRGNCILSGLEIPISSQAPLREFRFLRFAWKKVEGKRISLGIQYQKRMGAGERGEKRIRWIEAGEKSPEERLGILVSDRLPLEWEVVIRDLSEEIGWSYLTGLVFSSPDGEEALFDQIYLGRRLEDFKRL